MRINLWYCQNMEQWRWTLVDNRRPVSHQHSGQRPDLRNAMNDVATTAVSYTHLTLPTNREV